MGQGLRLAWRRWPWPGNDSSKCSAHGVKEQVSQVWALWWEGAPGFCRSGLTPLGAHPRICTCAIPDVIRGAPQQPLPVVPHCRRCLGGLCFSFLPTVACSLDLPLVGQGWPWLANSATEGRALPQPLVGLRGYPAPSRVQGSQSSSSRVHPPLGRVSHSHDKH